MDLHVRGNTLDLTKSQFSNLFERAGSKLLGNFIERFSSCKSVALYGQAGGR